ncbi:hypothetical protein H696_03861 [Fonticula alba]|uniref:DNA 3'-5' helicase n=1 Tax=Fonticula alba TaxID=691883 RepID=A0A058Z7D8_FONAL|nr:hypothetical protein H696_03861 [Fonticula alba]KCV69432.1 hypothetical protein H696_03861 [Fonticula alba]|eukprot:XP_009495997.1 hypothetical protein H696_03861 [Fonticula alba]
MSTADIPPSKRVRFDDTFVKSEQELNKATLVKLAAAAATGPPPSATKAAPVPQKAQSDSSAHSNLISPEDRPLWVTCDSADENAPLVFLESFSPLYQQACDFLVAIAEPRTRFLTKMSLYSAASVGLEPNNIIDTLQRFSKVPVPERAIEIIKQYMSTYGKVRLVMRGFPMEATKAPTIRLQTHDGLSTSASAGGSSVTTFAPLGLLGGPASAFESNDGPPKREFRWYLETYDQSISQRICSDPHLQQLVRQVNPKDVDEALRLAREATTAPPVAGFLLPVRGPGGDTFGDNAAIKPEPMAVGANSEAIVKKDDRAASSGPGGDNPDDDEDGSDGAGSDGDEDDDEDDDVAQSGKSTLRRSRRRRGRLYMFEILHPMHLERPNIFDSDSVSMPIQGGGSAAAVAGSRTRIQKIKQLCDSLNFPVFEEYAFRADTDSPTLDIDLKQTTIVRDYQQQCLSKMFSRERARSGIIVLPCGAGKTLVGVAAASTIKKNTLVLVNSTLSANQWHGEFSKWAHIKPHIIAGEDAPAPIITYRGGSRLEDLKHPSLIFITTYQTITNVKSRVMSWIERVEWGLVILDEVHSVPADSYAPAVARIPTHCKLGLTATLVREDGKIDEILQQVGPKLYEANWMVLSRQGHIARVICAEVRCPLTPAFWREYSREGQPLNIRTNLLMLNPVKLLVLQALLLRHHDKKTTVFVDRIEPLERYAEHFQALVIQGKTQLAERERNLQLFREDENRRVLFLSQIGDTSLDIPEASCLIEVSAPSGSRRQEAQRLGRILRAKNRNDEGFNAFFYTLIADGTDDVTHASKRQQYLLDQGYAYKVVQAEKIFSTMSPDERSRFRSMTPDDQDKLLDIVRNMEPRS